MNSKKSWTSLEEAAQYARGSVLSVEERQRQRGQKQWGTKGRRRQDRREGGMVKVSLYEIPLFSIYIKAEPGNRIQRGNLHFHGLLLTLPATPLHHLQPTFPILPNLSANHKSLSHPTHTFLLHSHSRTIVIHSHHPP